MFQNIFPIYHITQWKFKVIYVVLNITFYLSSVKQAVFVHKKFVRVSLEKRMQLYVCVRFFRQDG